MKNVFLLALCGFVTGTLLARIEPAYGVDAFKKEFESKYVKKDAADGPEKELAEAVTKAKCNVATWARTRKCATTMARRSPPCSRKPMPRTLKNPESSRPGRRRESSASDSPTFGELIKQGKLPGGAPTAPAAGGN